MSAVSRGRLTLRILTNIFQISQSLSLRGVLDVPLFGKSALLILAPAFMRGLSPKVTGGGLRDAGDAVPYCSVYLK